MTSKYVLTKSYYGLGGDLCVLVGAMRLAGQLGREVVADWNGGLFGRVPHGSLVNQYFESPRFAVPADLPDATLSVFPPQWEGRLLLPPLTYLRGVDLTLSRPEEVPADCAADCIVITRDSKLLHRRPELYFAAAQSLKPSHAIRSAVDALHATMGSTRPTIGIHFRHGNGERKVIPPDPRWFRNRINARLRALELEPDQISLFVATDCKGSLDYFARYYPHTFSSEKAYRPNGEGAMHVGRQDLSEADKLRLPVEALTDMYALAGCDYFIGSRGYFSLFVTLVRGKRHSVLYDGERLFDNYGVSDAFLPVAKDAVYGPAVARARVPLDGLFVRRTHDQRELLYYNDPIHSNAVSQAAAPDAQEIRRAIVARRTY
jgi:Nodulation protein Z (NodZ)